MNGFFLPYPLTDLLISPIGTPWIWRYPHNRNRTRQHAPNAHRSSMPSQVKAECIAKVVRPGAEFPAVADWPLAAGRLSTSEWGKPPDIRSYPLWDTEHMARGNAR